MTMPQRILAAVDFSPLSQSVTDHACELAAHHRAQLHMIHVDPKLAGPADTSQSAHVALNKLSQLLRPQDELDLETKKLVLGGEPHRVIIDYAAQHDVDLIVMGTHGREGIAHFALGSVAERVMRRATCPVQVVKRKPLSDHQLDVAAEAISETFGEQLTGELKETEQRICQVISAAIPCTAPAGRTLLSQLQEREWATWTPQDEQASSGTWEFVTGMEFLEDAIEFTPSTSNSPATDLVSRARALRATDIHIDPVSVGECRVRFRIDGKLEEYCRLDRSVADHLLNQWKLMAGLDVSEPFQPKEGRVAFPESEHKVADVEARLTSAPVANGQAVSLRLFTRSNLYIPLTNLGLGGSATDAIDQMLHNLEGLVIVSGPTGSGKTTTVYSMLESLSTSNQNVVSIEDPVEFPVPFVRQMAVDEKHGLDMTKGLTTLLRMDPDVIFLGEIRDAAAASIAMQAAASGRYVFSTLHTRDIAAVFTTLRDFGLADRSLAANISGIINQRLVRRLCKRCRREVSATDGLKMQCEQHGMLRPRVQFEAVGCAHCRGTGYVGRVGIFEAMNMTPRIREAVAEGHRESELRNRFIEDGLVTLDMAALGKVADGITDASEMSRLHWL